MIMTESEPDVTNIEHFMKYPVPYSNYHIWIAFCCVCGATFAPPWYLIYCL